MSQSMWFGTRGFETWVKAPQPGGDTSRVGFSGALQYLNGGAGIVASSCAHREYSWSWSNASLSDDMREIVDFADGVYDTADGINLIYFINPMDAAFNVLPQHWATPSLGGAGGMPLLQDTPPTLVATAPNGFRYPARSASYTITPTTVPVPLYLPVPPGMTPWVGVTGDAIVNVTSFIGLTPNVVTTPTGLTVTSATLVNTPITTPGLTGIELALKTVTTGTLTGVLTGLVVQMLPTGVSPTPGNFISGQGHSGCQFASHPTESPYSSAVPGGRVGMAAKLVETGAWL